MVELWGEPFAIKRVIFFPDFRMFRKAQFFLKIPGYGQLLEFFGPERVDKLTRLF